MKYTLTSNGEQLSKLNMNLFGIPHQFPEAVDPRIGPISQTLGKNFIDKIISTAPVLTLIPGVPKYLSTEDEDTAYNTTVALLDKASGSFDALNQIMDDNRTSEMRLYDFDKRYSEYMQYVNVLCRAGAAFLEIEDTITTSSGEFAFTKFDWRNYRWNDDATMNVIERTKLAISALKNTKKPTKKKTKGMSKKQKKEYLKQYKKEMNAYKKQKESARNSLASFGVDVSEVSEESKSTNTAFSFEMPDIEDTPFTDAVTDYNYVQFYVDPESSPSDSFINEVGPSSLKGLADGADSTIKDLAFMINSGGGNAETIQKIGDNSVSAIQGMASELLGGANSGGPLNNIVNRIGNMASNVIKGENIIIPDIYQSSSYSKSYSITIHLRSPYGTSFAYYMNIFVPLMHLLALVLPRQGSSNSYSSPFLVKGYLEGLWTVNMGIVSNLTIAKDVETWNTDGLPTAVDVTLEIQDLYSDMAMTPNDKPLLFVNNSSLIEYLATTCGMSLTKPNFEAKFKLLANSVATAFTDIPSDVGAMFTESVNKIINSFTLMQD